MRGLRDLQRAAPVAHHVVVGDNPLLDDAEDVRQRPGEGNEGVPSSARRHGETGVVLRHVDRAQPTVRRRPRRPRNRCVAAAAGAVAASTTAAPSAPLLAACRRRCARSPAAPAPDNPPASSARGLPSRPPSAYANSGCRGRCRRWATARSPRSSRRARESARPSPPATRLIVVSERDSGIRRTAIGGDRRSANAQRHAPPGIVPSSTRRARALWRVPSSTFAWLRTLPQARKGLGAPLTQGARLPPPRRNPPFTRLRDCALRASTVSLSDDFDFRERENHFSAIGEIFLFSLQDSFLEVPRQHQENNPASSPALRPRK